MTSGQRSPLSLVYYTSFAGTISKKSPPGGLLFQVTAWRGTYSWLSFYALYEEPKILIFSFTVLEISSFPGPMSLRGS